MKTMALSLMIGMSGLAIVATLTGCASTPTRESTGEVIDDSAITAKIKATYAGDRDVSALQVGVETYKGVVQLSGFVDKAYAKQKAGELAKNVRGVTSVENNIIVKPLGNNDTGGSDTNSLSQYSGELTAIDTTNKTVTIRKALISHNFQYGSGLDTMGISVGDQVNVTYQDTNGVNNVIRLEKVAPKDSTSNQ